MRYLVTGGTGFIGRALCAQLAGNGDEVVVLTREPARATRVLPPGVRPVPKLEDAARPDVVINLAGENLGSGRWTAARKRLFRDSRLGITRQLVEWMTGLSDRPRVLVSGSAVGYYGVCGDEEITEDAPPGSVLQGGLDLCADWEAEARKAESLGVRVCLVRTGLVLHPEGGGLQQMLPAFRLGLGGPLGDGRQYWSWIHRDDLVALMLWLARTAEAQGPYNGTAPNPVTQREFARTLGRVLRRPAILPMPAFALRLLLGDMAELLLTGQNVVPARALAEGFPFSHPELEGALRQMLQR